MRRVAVLALAAALLFPASVAAAPSCANCPPTIVVVNGDGTITASTDTVPNGGCIGAVAPTKYACNLYVEDVVTGGEVGFQTDGGPTTVPVYLACPCVAYFKVHAGQWKQYSADSAPFTP
jgi:hypothetical protein